MTKQCKALRSLDELNTSSLILTILDDTQKRDLYIGVPVVLEGASSEDLRGDGSSLCVINQDSRVVPLPKSKSGGPHLRYDSGVDVFCLCQQRP